MDDTLRLGAIAKLKIVAGSHLRRFRRPKLDQVLIQLPPRRDVSSKTSKRKLALGLCTQVWW